MKKLDDISTFGGIDADTDVLLEKCFEDHEAYIETKAHNKFLVLGRKGSGKTAIFRKYLSTRSYDVFTFGHTFTDYPWHHHDKQAVIGVPEEQRYVHSWRYLILITTAKILLNQDQSQPWSDVALEEMRKIERFVVDSYGSRDPDVTQVFSPAKTLRFHSSFQIPLTSLNLSLKMESVPLDKLPTIVQEVNRNLTDAVIAALNPQFHYYVCFDQLDLGFDPSDKAYRDRLVGLILAARDLNVMAQQAEKHFSILIFLRDDIYQTLRFEDKNKVTEAFATRIEWDTVRAGKTLRQLMEKRFSEVLEIPEEKSWENVFDEREQMPGRQSKYQHMIDRTFLRPRDMIKFCNETLAAFKVQNDPEKQPQFTNKDINAARPEYSRYFLNEIDDEIFKHIQNYQAYIEILKSLNSLQFTKADFDQAYVDRRRLFTQDVNTSAILQELFDFSLIGYYVAGGAGYGGSEYIWKYMDPRALFNESATSFRVHPGLKETLGLKKFTRSA